MSFYEYKIPEADNLNVLYCRTEEQVISLLENYNRDVEAKHKVAIPERGSLEQKDIFARFFSGGLINLKDRIEGREVCYPILDDVVFSIADANAFNIMKMAIEYSKPDGYGLNKLIVPSWHIMCTESLFVPDEVIVAAREYDWNKHSQELSELRAANEAVRKELVDAKVLEPKEKIDA